MYFKCNVRLLHCKKHTIHSQIITLHTVTYICLKGRFLNSYMLYAILYGDV